MAPSEADPREWLDRASADLRVAELTLAVPGLPTWAAGFHLQQAAEKALKAVLVAHGRAAPRTHDVGLLADEVETLVPALQGWGERLLALNDFAVAQRYPGVPHPEMDLERLSDDVRALLEAAATACGSVPPPS